MHFVVWRELDDLGAAVSDLLGVVVLSKCRP